MNKKQLQHFLKNGLFTAIYRPLRTNDFLDEGLSNYVNKRITIHRNYDVCPTPGGEFKGYKFFMLNKIRYS